MYILSHCSDPDGTIIRGVTAGSDVSRSSKGSLELCRAPKLEHLPNNADIFTTAPVLQPLHTQAELKINPLTLTLTICKGKHLQRAAMKRVRDHFHWFYLKDMKNSNSTKWYLEGKEPPQEPLSKDFDGTLMIFFWNLHITPPFLKAFFSEFPFQCLSKECTSL